MYKTDFAKQLDEGTAGVTIKGKVVFCLIPKHVVSAPGAQKVFDFWSQFIAVEDDKGSMGANITFGKEEEKKKNGDIVQVQGKIHKYDATNKKTGEKEQKIVLNSAKIIETPEEIAKKEEKKNLQEKGKEEVTKEKPVNINNNNSQLSNEKEIRKEAVKIAFDYGAKNGFAIYDCFDLAKIIGTYIDSGEIDIKEIAPKMTKLERRTKSEPESESKPVKKDEDKSAKNNNDLEELFKRGQDMGLPTWVELISFAIEKKVFPDKTGIEVARNKLLINENDCYNALIDFIDISEEVSKLDKGKDNNEHNTGEIPF